MNWLMALIVGMLSWTAQAQVVLFTNGQQVENYNQLIMTLESGQTIQFSNGEQYEVKEILGHGNTTLIVSNGVTARRIPLWRGHRGLVVEEGEPNPYDLKRLKREGASVPNWLGPNPADNNLPYDGRFTEIHREFGISQQELEIAGVQVLPLDFKKSVPGEYWEVPKVEVMMTLDQFIDRMESLPETEVDLRLAQLREMILSTYKCSAAGDFAPRQIALVGDRWVLLDHRSGVVPAIVLGGSTAVTFWNRSFPGPERWRSFIEGVEWDIKVRRSERGDYSDIQIPIRALRQRERPSWTPSEDLPRGARDRNCDVMSQGFDVWQQLNF